MGKMIFKYKNIQIILGHHIIQHSIPYENFKTKKKQRFFFKSRLQTQYFDFYLSNCKCAYSKNITYVF